MPLVTTILRVRDHLPLCGTQEVTPKLRKLSNLAKPIMKSVTHSIKKQIIDSHEHYFAYKVDNEICVTLFLVVFLTKKK